MQRTTIQWTGTYNAAGVLEPGFTSNPIRYDDNGKPVWACIKDSPGCANCYAEAIAKRWKRGKDFTPSNMYGLSVYADEDECRKMLGYRPAKGKRCFLGDMTDIFGSWVRDDQLYLLFACMAVRRDVTWQILTKRAARLCVFMNRPETHEAVERRAHSVGLPRTVNVAWPPPNIWCGVSVENDVWAAKRLQGLRDTRAAVRFISYEPALGPVDWDRHFGTNHDRRQPGQRNIIVPPAVEWIIVGGESGWGARPFNIGWARDTIRWGRDNGVPVFVKQLGSQPYCDERPPIDRVGLKLKDRAGGDPAEWPADLNVRSFPCPKP